MVDTGTFVTADGLSLQYERSAPPAGVATRALAVLCHPHPAHGGTMQSVVVSPLFAALPPIGIDTLRFNFRGVQGSQGSFDNGDGEQNDVTAAVDALRMLAPARIPLVLIGFSFGADLAMSCLNAEVDAYCMIAPPFRFAAAELDSHAFGKDARPKQIILAAHDDFRDPQWVLQHVAQWPNLRTQSVAGANHFFVARTEAMIAIVAGFFDEVAATTS